MKTAMSTMLLVVLFGCAPERAPEEEITVARVERTLATLSDDSMLGRETFTPAIDRAARFIAEQFATAELKPLEGVDGYLQEFPAYTLTLDSGEVVLDGRTIPAERCIFAVNQTSIHWTTGADVEVVAVGPNDNSMQAFSRVRSSNTDMLVLFHERHARFFNRLQSYASGARTTMELGERGDAVYVLTSDMDVKSYDVTVNNALVEKPLANVVGVIPGRRRDEVVVFGAHYDHIGVRSPEDGDSIANGANDNATGTTAVIALARYFSQLRRPERTLVFAAFTGEEIGGYGSRYLAGQLDPDRVVAMVNFEMLGKPETGHPDRAWVTGYEMSSLGEILRGAVDTTEFSFYADPQPDQNLFMRSDNVAFARLGIPAHTISTGLLEDDHDYHRVTDEIETLDLDHLTRTIVAIARAVEPLTTGAATPSRIDPSRVNGR